MESLVSTSIVLSIRRKSLRSSKIVSSMNNSQRFLLDLVFLLARDDLFVFLLLITVGLSGKGSQARGESVLLRFARGCEFKLLIQLHAWSSRKHSATAEGSLFVELRTKFA